MVALRPNSVLAYLKSVGPYLVLPGLVLLAIMAVLGPEMWSAVYASAKVCRAWMVESLLFGALPALAIFLFLDSLVVFRRRCIDPCNDGRHLT